MGKVLDPRSDLKKDSDLWSILLTVAKRESPMVYGLLHGLRCGGTTLTWSGTSPRRLKLDTRKLVENGRFTREELLEKWLIPQKVEITKVIRETEVLAKELEEMRQRKGASA